MDPRTTLSAVWAHISRHADNGLHCPACGQYVQKYWRSINAGQAASAVRMLRLHNQSPGRWVHLPTEIGRRSAEEAKLSWWGLVEDEGSLRADGGRAGYWRLTPKGVQWARGLIRVPRYVVVFDNQPWGDGRPTPYSKAGERKPDVSVLDALGSRFDYDKLMAGE